MKVYPDTSFMVSWLYAHDINHPKAAHWFATHHTDQWIISVWTEFETINTLRGLVLHSPGPTPASMESRRRYFKHLFRNGPLERETVDWLEVLKDAHQVSSTLATRIRARAADILHVAILEQCNPDVFVTFDRNQSLLAINRGFTTEYLK